MGVCSCTAKGVLAFLGLIFWAAAGGLFFVGAYIFSGYQHFEQIADATYTLIPATIIISVGVFFLILGIVGCIGAFKEHKCLLGTFFTLLLIILVGLVAGAVLAYVFRKDIDKALKTGIDNCMTSYGNDSVCTKEVDFMQETLHCCGSMNYSDWQNTEWYKEAHAKNATVEYPESCCSDSQCNYTSFNDTGVYTQGCHEKMESVFRGHLGIVIGVGAALAVLQILGMIFSCVLICMKKRDGVPYIGLNEPGGMRV